MSIVTIIDMNNHIYLTIADMDKTIIDLLDPPSILTMTEVNKHYRNILKNAQQEFCRIKYDFKKCCMNGSDRLLEWLDSFNTGPFCYSEPLVNASKYGRLQLVMKKCEETNYGEHIIGYAFDKACQFNQINIVKYLMNKYEKYTDLSMHSGYAAAYYRSNDKMCEYLTQIDQEKKLKDNAYRGIVFHIL